MFDFVALEDNRLEDGVNVFVEFSSNMDGAEVGLIHRVGNEFVGDSRGIQEAADIGFLLFLGH